MTSTLDRPRSPGMHAARPVPRGRATPPRRTQVAQQRPGHSGRRGVQTGSVRRRVGWLMLLTMIGIVGVGARLTQIQVLDRATYADLGERQGTTSVDIAAPRGAILDRNLSVLVLSDGRPTVYADPRQVIDPVRTAAELALVLDIDEQVTAARLASDRSFVYIARQVSLEDRDRVAELTLPGVGFLDEPTRLHPNGDDLAKGVLGALDIDQNPLSGVEQQYGEMLAGSEGHQEAQVSRSGLALPVGTKVNEAAEAGHDLVLTLNTEIQWLTEQSLLEAVARSGAKGGMVVVMEVGTGEILALAGATRDTVTGDVRVASHTPAFSQIFEPGSVNKTFTIAAALEERVVRPLDLFSIPPLYEFADKVFSEPHSSVPQALTVTEILAKSSNIGTIQIAETIGGDRLYQYLRRFGFGERTGIGGASTVPAESAGILHPANDWHGTGLATISFGQGVAVTAVQLAAAYNTIANDGVYLAPSLYRGTVGPDGSFHPVDAGARRRVLTAETSAVVREMLASVVTEGTGGLAAVDGFVAAGKTGTAQKPLEDRAGYSETAYMSTFAGFVPAAQPELTVVVSIDEPAEQHVAGIVAAPVFSEIAEYALRVLRVAPTE